MRLARIALILLLQAGVIFGIYGQFFAVQKTKAQVSPPAPSPVNLSFKFTSSDKTQTKVTMMTGTASPQYLFNDVGTITPDQIKSSDLPATADGTKAAATDQIFLQNLTSPSGITCSINTTVSWSSPIYMIAWKPVSTGLWTAGGIYITDITNPKIYMRIPNSYFDLGRDCGAVAKSNSDLVTMIKAANSSTWLGTRIFFALNTADKDAVCTEMGTNWDQIKGSIRTLLTHLPPADMTYYKDVGTAATTTFWSLAMTNLVLGGGGGFAAGGPVGAGIGVIAGAELTAAETGWGNDLSSSIHYVLNDNGTQLMNTIYSQAQQLQQEAAQLNDGSGIWPCTNKLRVFKYNAALESDANVYKNMDDFSAAINETMKQFEKFKGIITSPTVSGPNNGDVCGGLSGTIFNGWSGILNSISCGIAQFLHNSAAYFMSLAFEILDAFIGVDIKFDCVKQPDSPSCIPAKTPATTTPAATGTGATTGGSSSGTGGGTTSDTTYAFNKNLTFKPVAPTPGNLCEDVDIAPILNTPVDKLNVTILYNGNTNQIPAAATKITKSGTGFIANIVSRTALPSGTTKYSVDVSAGSYACRIGFTN